MTDSEMCIKFLIFRTPSIYYAAVASNLVHKYPHLSDAAGSESVCNFHIIVFVILSVINLFMVLMPFVKNSHFSAISSC